MTQMYVITMNSGEYEDAYTSVVAVTDDLARGEEYVQDLNHTYESLENKEKQYNEQVVVKWMKDNPMPVTESVNTKNIPRWESHVMVTKDMRAQRAELHKYNDELRRKAYEPRREWGKMQADFKQKWFDENLNQKEKDLLKVINHTDYHSWSIEAAPML